MKSKEQKRLEAALRILEGARISMEVANRLELELALFNSMDPVKTWNQRFEIREKLTTKLALIDRAIRQARDLDVNWKQVKAAWDRKWPVLSRWVIG